MLTDQLLAISLMVHEVILWLLIILSVLSLAVILERFFFLRNFFSETVSILLEIISALESGRNSHMKLVYDKYSLLLAGKLLQKSWEHIIEKRDRGLEEIQILISRRFFIILALLKKGPLFLEEGLF